MVMAEGSFWPKILASFAAGIVCMSLISENTSSRGKPAPAQTAALVAPAAPPVAPAPDVAPPVIATAPAPAPVAAIPPSLPDPVKAEGPEARGVRVISTDKIASDKAAPVGAAAPAGPSSPAVTEPKKAPAKKPGPDLAGLPSEPVEEGAALTRPPAPVVAASPPVVVPVSPVPTAPVVAQPPTVVASAPVSAPSPVASAAAPAPSLPTGVADPAPAPMATTAAAPLPPRKPDLAPSVVSKAANPDARAVADIRDRRRAQRRYARDGEPYPALLPAERRALMRQGYVEEIDDGRVRSFRYPNGRVVTMRVPPREARMYEYDDLPPPPYRRYRQPDSLLSWLGSRY